MTRWHTALGLLLLSTTAPAQPGPSMRGDGPPPEPRPFSITRLDPALDVILAPDARLELLASGFGLNEGPVWVPEGDSGYLLISGLLDNVIYRIDADNRVSVFMERAGYTGNEDNRVGAQTRSGRSHVLLIGPSCTGLDSSRRLIWCADNDRTLMRYEVNPDGSLGAGMLFAEGAGIGDGMKTDEAGNLYSTNGAGPGLVRIMAPDATLLGYINLPVFGGEPKRQICATNVAFGDADGRSLFITACDDVYRIRLRVRGAFVGGAAGEG